MEDYRENYAALTDDQLLKVALDAEQLVPMARSALTVEMANRGLGAQDIAEYAEHLRMGPSKPESMGVNFHGFGTILYGKRAFDSHGSYVTTKWVVFGWIPLVPLRSLRVLYVGRRGGKPIWRRWTRQYLVLSKSRPDIRQVVHVYSFVASAFVLDWLLGSIHAGEVVQWAVMAVWACTPWALRRWARIRG